MKSACRIYAMVLRYGLGAESFAWVSIFALAPLSGIYYPISTLPEWLQPVFWTLPFRYVFEGMRQLMFDQLTCGDLMVRAAGLTWPISPSVWVSFSAPFTTPAATGCCCGRTSRLQSFLSRS